jgi:hypothetical protein
MAGNFPPHPTQTSVKGPERILQDLLRRSLELFNKSRLLAEQSQRLIQASHEIYGHTGPRASRGFSATPGGDV